MKPLLLLTGGTGMVGAILLPELRRSYRIRISAHTPPPPGTITADDELLVGDLRDATEWPLPLHCARLEIDRGEHPPGWRVARHAVR